MDLPCVVVAGTMFEASRRAKGCHAVEPADEDVNIVAGRDDDGRPQSLRHEMMHFLFR
jgi:hypothetical protein